MADEQENETPGTPPQEAAAEAPAQESAADVSASAPARTTPPEPVEQLSPKERRRKARSTRGGSARASRTPEERQAERDAERRRKAVRRRARRLQERTKRTSARERAGTATSAPVVESGGAEQGTRKVRQGIVVSDKADKTITVRIDVARRHRRYEKIVRSSNTLHAHDEGNEAHEGDVVRVIESRPLSRTKRWRLVDVLERAR
jgi:small subunit ribosomal protein S17